jgi:hypothetical protein
VSWYLVGREPAAESAPREPAAALATHASSESELAPAAPSLPSSAPPAAVASSAEPAASGAQRAGAAEPAEAGDEQVESRRERRERRRRERAEAEQAEAASAPVSDSEPRVQVETRARPGPGTVLVGTSQGWALVFEGSKQLGTTPLKLELSSGTHTLTVRPYGEGSPRQVAVEVKPGQVTKLRLPL